MRNTIISALVPLFTVATLLSVASCKSHKPGKTVNIEVPATHIQRIVATDAVHVVYTPSEKETSVTVVCDTNYVGIEDVRVVDGTLYAGIKAKKGIPTSGIEVQVKAPAVTCYEAGNAARINNRDKYEINGDVTVKTATAGQVTLNNLKCTTLNITATTASNVTTAGLNCQKLTANLTLAASAYLEGNSEAATIACGTSASYSTEKFQCPQITKTTTKEPYTTPEERRKVYREKQKTKQKAEQP